MIQHLSEADLPAAAALLDRVGLPSAASNVARYLRWQPDGVWGLFEAGALVGTISLLHFGRVGFVGCMAVEPARQGHRLGRTLLEHAHRAAQRAGITTLLLEATASGRPLYEKLGYFVEYETAVVSRSHVTPSAPTALHAERASILDLDRRATCSTRDAMIGDLVDRYPGAVARATHLVGYGLVVGDRLGPVIAGDPGAGRALIANLAGACTVAGVPVLNEDAMTAFSASGFTPQRTLHRMRLGPPVASHAGWLWALASAGAG
jgi:GNAT superfamily N-acetyltransferase